MTLQDLTVDELLATLLASALLATSVGFRRTVWFISIGYTAAVVAFAGLTAALRSNLELHNAIQLGALAAWGLRLGYFLVQRERNAVYRGAVADQTGRAQSLPALAKVGIWIAVSLLYVSMFSPAVLSTVGTQGLGALAIVTISVGALVLVAGVVLEAVADRQKSRFKAEHPQAFVNAGLYGWVRCPNYLGEVLVWLGNYLVGAVFFASWWHWLMASAGLVSIVLIMMGSAKRLEVKHEERYGSDEAYRTYSGSVPILFPWVPVFTFKRLRVYLG